ncbi:hypothetical protein DSO57_1005665 [Entomophthora muscae]|uniref:Uncharacterized protein n=1 Tax=Entomophthora muscae TaxID=34485 RepID=A0ACC2RZ27_9FUNG|nr:hypothetical protein DSO57_1005665 [Entomophthora muscae]
MNLNITWIALLSYARYRRIVRRKMFPQWLWVLIEVVISLPIVVFCLLGGFFRLYVIIPGSFLCQIWSPTRDDPIRTPIQLYFSLNLVVSLATTVVCYTCVSLHQHRALENLLESEGSANNEGSYLQQPEAVYSQCDLDVDEPGISFLETHLGDSIKENLDVYYQQKMIRFRTAYSLLAYLFCHLPEALIGLGEILSGFTRSHSLSSIAFQPRFLFALINPLVILAMHAHSREALFTLVRKISSKIFD